MRIDSPSVARISADRPRRMRLLAWAMVLGSILVPVAVMALDVGKNAFWTTLLCAAIAFVVAVATSATYRGESVAGRRHYGPAASVDVDPSGIRVRGVTIRAADVIEGFREEYGARHQVVLQLPRETWAIEVSNAVDADALLDAVGVGLFQRAITLQIGSITSRAARAAIALFSALGALFAVPLTLLFVLALAGVVVGVHGWDVASAGISFALMSVAWGVFLGGARLLGVRTLRIGRDGVAVKLGLAPAAFVPYRGMVVERTGRVLSIAAGLAKARLPTTGVPEAIALARRIEEARAAFDARSAMRAELLARQGRPLDAWRDAIRKLAVADGYRDGIGRDDLLAIVEDPSALPDERVAAASALGALPDEPRVRTRLAAAIATTVEPKLRVALERAVDGVIDEGALDAAIARRGAR